MKSLRWMSLMVLVSVSALAQAPMSEHCARLAAEKARAAQQDAPRYARSVEQYRLPDVTLVDQDGNRVRLAEALKPTEDVAVNFVFTTCTTVCPVMSATFRSLGEKVGKGGA